MRAFAALSLVVGLIAVPASAAEPPLLADRVAAGELPPEESNGKSYIKIPINAF